MSNVYRYMVPLTFSWYSICPIGTIKTNCMDVLNTFKESTTTSTGENTTEANDDGVKGEEGGGDDDDDDDEEEEEDVTSDDESCDEYDEYPEEDELVCEPEDIMYKQSKQNAVNDDYVNGTKLELATDAVRKLLSADVTFTDIPADEYFEKVALLQAAFASQYNKIVFALQYDKSKEVPPSSIKEALEPISKVCSRYSGKLEVEQIETFQVVRVSTGTEDHNTGFSQEVKVKASMSQVDKIEFDLPLVSHPKTFRSVDKRKHPEKCRALMESIIAICHSKSKYIQLWINDILRIFPDVLSFDFITGIIKALNPNKDITFISNDVGVRYSLKDLRHIVWTIHEREQRYSAIGISHKSPSTSVPVNTNEMICGMNPIEHRTAIAEESIKLRGIWKATGKPERIKSAIKAGEELANNDKTPPIFRNAVRKVKNEYGNISSSTDSSTNQNNSTHHILSRTREGECILWKEANTFFDDSNSSVEASDYDIVVGYVRNSNLYDTEDEQLSIIMADIELRKLTDKKLIIIIEKGKKRSSICNEGMAKVLDMLRARQVSHLFMARPNRAGSDSIAVQILLHAPGVDIIFSEDRGKDVMAIVGKEDERMHKRKQITDACNAIKERKWQVVEAETSLQQINKTLRKISGMNLTKEILKQVAHALECHVDILIHWRKEAHKQQHQRWKQCLLRETILFRQEERRRQQEQLRQEKRRQQEQEKLRHFDQLLKGGDWTCAECGTVPSTNMRCGGCNKVSRMLETCSTLLLLPSTNHYILSHSHSGVGESN